MAQPAGFMAQDNRTEMGISVFWTSASSDPPWNFKVWLDQFKLAVTVKENVNPEIILEHPKEVVDEPMPRPDTPGEAQNAQAVTEREARDKLRDKVILENQERRERGAKVGHNVFFYNEVQKRLTSRLFLALGTEGKRNLYRKTHTRKFQNWNFEKWWHSQNNHSKRHEILRTNDIDCSLELRRQVRR